MHQTATIISQRHSTGARYCCLYIIVGQKYQCDQTFFNVVTQLEKIFIGVAVFMRIGVNSYWAQGLKPPPTFMIMGLAYMTSPPPTFVT